MYIAKNNFYHNSSVSNISGVGGEGFLFGVDNRFLNYLDRPVGDYVFTPFRWQVSLGQKPESFEAATSVDRPEERVFGQDVCAEGVGVALPEAFGHLLPRVVKHGLLLKEFHLGSAIRPPAT